MYKKLTITLEEEIYEGLHRVIGRGAISQFIAELVRPHVVATDLHGVGYLTDILPRAVETITRRWGEQGRDLLLRDNPRAILEGRFDQVRAIQ